MNELKKVENKMDLQIENEVYREDSLLFLKKKRVH
jgi:hypothetical protein